MSYLDATGDDYDPVATWEIPNIVKPPIRNFECSGCNEVYSVRAIRLDYNWHYRMKCPICERSYSNLYRIKTRCPTCCETTFVTERNRFGACRICKGGYHPRGGDAITGMEEE